MLVVVVVCTARDYYSAILLYGQDVDKTKRGLQVSLCLLLHLVYLLLAIPRHLFLLGTWWWFIYLRMTSPAAFSA